MNCNCDCLDITVPTSPEVLLRYATDASGTNATNGTVDNPNPLTYRWISFSTDGGTTYSNWQEFIGESAGSFGILTNIFGNYSNIVGSTGTWGDLSAASSLTYTLSANSLSDQDFLDIEAYFDVATSSDPVALRLVFGAETIATYTFVAVPIAMKVILKARINAGDTATNEIYVTNGGIKFLGSPTSEVTEALSTFSTVSLSGNVTIKPQANITTGALANTVVCKNLVITKYTS